MVDNYTDRRIETDADGLRIKQYYIPVGDKRFRWEAIRSVGRVKLGTLRGSLRFWAPPTRATGRTSISHARASRTGSCSTWAEAYAPSSPPTTPPHSRRHCAHTDAPIDDRGSFI